MNIFKGKTKLVIFIQIIFIGIIIIGSTFAVRYLYETISTSLTTANIGVIYTGESKIDTTGIIPIKEEDIETDAVKLEFTVKGTQGNPDINIVYDVSLNDINIGKGLISKDFKWKLYKNGVLNASSDFSDIGTINGNSVQTYERAILTSEVQRLPKYTDEPDSYTLYIYILDTGELQTSLMGQTFNAKIKIETYTTKGGSTKRSKYNSLVENNLPNAPELAEGMIPVKYDGTNWVKADSTNSNNDWYNYSSKKWANAVMVSGKSIIDKSGNNNNGIIHGEPTISNGEITFDGVDDYVDLGMANREFSTNMTVVARVKMLNNNQNISNSILENCENAGIELDTTSDNQFRFSIYDTITSSYQNVALPTAYTINTWYTIVGRYNGTELSLWINGTKVAFKTVAITYKTSIMPIIIGGNPQTYEISEQGNFTVSNIMMYERALTDTEITNLSSNINNHPKSENDNLLFDFNNFISVNQREVYMNAKEGTTIAENDILTYHVWIPRYRYKLFNVESKTLSELGLSEPPQIDIVFESETAEINNGTCNGIYENPTNECYYSHPSFWWDDDSDGVRETGEELKGIWVGKFETTGYADIPTIKPNQKSLAYQNVSTQFTTSQKMGTSTYLTTNGVSEIDAHMAKNIDWGATAYLTQSKYGRCKNGTCEEIRRNNNSNFISGYSAVNKAITGWSNTPSVTNEFGTSSDITNSYNTEIGLLASTTGNIYGIYDMSGGSHEHIMGVMSDNTEEKKPMSGNNITKNSGYEGKTYDGTKWVDVTGESFPDSKYYDLYEYNTSKNETIACQINKLGDATGETYRWYDDNIKFINNDIPWITRGAYSNTGFGCGLFSGEGKMGQANIQNAFRSVLINK